MLKRDPHSAVPEYGHEQSRQKIAWVSSIHSPMIATVVAAVVAILIGLTWQSTVYADNSLQTKQMEVERQLGCPVCTNLPLNVCDNEICQQMRGVIQQKLREGETPDQVVQFFVARYGPGVLLTPPQHGFSLAAWYIPVIGVIFGALVLYTFLKHSLRRQRIIEHRFTLNEDPTLDRYRQQVRRDIEAMENPR